VFLNSSGCKKQAKQKQAKSSTIPYQPLLSRPAMFCPQIQTAIHIL